MLRRTRIRGHRGFTLIELMIVMSILLILITIAIPLYTGSILRARESVLRQDLFTMRQVIDQYTLDRQKAPQSLEDLVNASYIKQIPVDPFTGRNDTWQTVQEDTSLEASNSEPGIVDVHSGSQYKEW